jgi:CxxC-x17-CxxC domain-containing protein
VSYLAYEDKTLTCRDCGNPFNFTASEQEFFVQKGFTNDPSRCNECRAARKTARGGTSYDNDRGANGGGYSGGGNDRGGYGGGGGYSRAPREMFSAICSECGQTAQVPFQPRNDKPVYCSSCFEQKRSYR